MSSALLKRDGESMQADEDRDGGRQTLEDARQGKFDVVIVGAGNAALCSALAACDGGARVLVLECAPEEESGGNSRFTAGAIRFAYAGVEDLAKVMPHLTEAEKDSTDFGSYGRDQFYDDMGRVTQYRCDPTLTEMLVENSLETMVWLRHQGVRFMPMYGRQAFKVEGRFKFWGGLTVEASGGGPGLVDSLVKAAEAKGAAILYRARATELVCEGSRVKGVKIRHRDTTDIIPAVAVVLASGGFEANAAWRAQYLGPNWDLAKVRGSRFNTGEGIRMALAAGASPAGNWSGCHAVGWERNAPEFGDLVVGDQFQKHSYPFGIMVNAHGERFVDEGADFRNYTYAKYGRAILEQPGQFAWQVFDAKVVHLLRDEYRIQQVTRVQADTLEELAGKLEDVDPSGFLRTVASFNGAVQTDVAFNPNIKDGRATQGISPPKSNWANKLDSPPYEAYAVTCGITFTFGGLRVGKNAQVLDCDGEPISGLFAAGELIGGLFYFNYPGGTGLMAGAVFGKLAGESAAAAVRHTAERTAE
jgi:tricarballylate dehydrogenase